MLVDYQCHWFSPAYFESLLDRGRERFPRAERDGRGGYVFWFDEEPVGNPWRMAPEYFDLDRQTQDMDAHGIDVAVMAPCLIGEVSHLELSEALETVTFVNEETARFVNELPDRRRGLAMLPMQDTSAAIEALDDAVNRLKLSGVSMITNVAGRPLASEETLPVFRRIAELGLPIVLHPSSRSLVFDSVKGLGRGTEVGLSWMFETSAAALSLIYSGTLSACPGLTVVHPHLGGVLPYLQARFETVHRMHLPGERSLQEYLREHFFTDTVNTTPGALEMAVNTYGSDRILFATDFPWCPRSDVITMLTERTEPDLAEVIRNNQLPGLKLPQTAG